MSAESAQRRERIQDLVLDEDGKIVGLETLRERIYSEHDVSVNEDGTFDAAEAAELLENDGVQVGLLVTMVTQDIHPDEVPGL